MGVYRNQGRKPPLQDKTPTQNVAAFVTWKKDDKIERAEAINRSNALNEYTSIQRTEAFLQDNRFYGIKPNVSVRDGFTRGDYEYFRPEEAVPKRQKLIIAYCMEAYRKVGLIRNVIDLMADFTTQGIRLVHPNPTIQKVHDAWFKKVRGPERSERIVHMLYRAGNCIVKRATSKITIRDVEQMQALGWSQIDNWQPLNEDLENPVPIRTESKVIPTRYDILHPISLEVIGGELSQFVGRNSYAMKIPQQLRRTIANPTSDFDFGIIASLPSDIVRSVQAGDKLIPLDARKLRVLHYKKDDWQTWADPITYAIFDDLVLLEKLRLADLAALDGAISQVRLWRLGSLEHDIYPTDAAVAKLADILLSNPGGGAFDIIWGPELDFKESTTNVYNFLGSAKYEPALNAIYAGLGIPPTLTGTVNAGGFTNNYISLQTLVKRLSYGRMILKSFWDMELELFQKAMGYRFPAQVQFDRMILTDESAEKALLVQLADRNIISYETLLERFGEMPDLERLRLRKETRMRRNGQMVPKAGPWNDPEKYYQLAKIALTKGFVDTDQAVHISTEETTDEMPNAKGGTPFQQQMKVMKMKGAGNGTPGPLSDGGQSGQPQQGRPKNSKDSGSRPAKKPTMRTAADLAEDNAPFMARMIWAKEAVDEISNIIAPGVLSHYGKKNLRSLSAEQMAEFEKTKFAILCNFQPFTEVNAESIDSLLATKLVIPQRANHIEKMFIGHVRAKQDREPTTDELRTIQVATYALLYGE